MRSVLVLILSLLPAAAFAGSGDSFLLRGVAVHPVSAPSIADGAVLVIDGKIAGVGPKIAAPRGVRVIDAKGLHVYPGMIDSATTLGLMEISSVPEMSDFSEIGDFNPQLQAIKAVNPASEHIPVTRANGITSAVTIPSGRLIGGQAALIRLDGWTWEEMALKPSAALTLRFPVPAASAESMYARQRGQSVPFAEMKRNYDRQLRSLKEFFEQARRYQKAREAKAPDFRTNLTFEAMLPVLEGKLPVLVTAVRERAIREALKFAADEKIRIILIGPREPEKFLEELRTRSIPVVLGPVLAAPLDEDDAYDKPFTLPAALHSAGVRFAFSSSATSFSRNLPYQAGTAVAFGLPREEAIKALTLYPAQIWGVSDQVGSIEEGKWADLMVTDGDPLEVRTQVKHLFIKGKPVDLDNKHYRLYRKHMERQ